MKASSSHRLSLVERKDLGAFYTPRAMTDFVAAWAVRGPAERILDPGCGDAAFLLGAAGRLKALGATAQEISAQLTGVDLNDDAVATAGAELAERGVLPRLLSGNFFSFTAQGLFPTLPSFDAVIGNPPYVRYQLFREENRAAGLRAALRSGVLLPQLSSSWAPYLIHATSFLQPGGRLAMVLPGELLHVGYAAAVRSFLLQHFRDLTILSFEEKVFPGAMEEVVILLGTKGAGDGRLRVCRLQSLADLREAPAEVLTRARVSRVAPGERWLTALLEQEAVAAALDVVHRARFESLGTLGRVDIGVVTGANDFFVLTRDRVERSRLPSTVLVPVVSKAAHVRGIRYGLADWQAQENSGSPCHLLLVNGDDRSEALARYLAQGEALGLPARYKCRTRKPWFRVPYVRKPDLFLTYMNHIAPRLVVNDAGVTSTNTVHGVFLSDPLLAVPLAAAFQNSATLLSAEIEGRSYGGGVLKIEPGEAVRILVPRLTPRVLEKLTGALPRIDALVRGGRLDEASAVVDTIVLGKSFRQVDIEKIRSVLHGLRARRLARNRTS